MVGVEGMWLGVGDCFGQIGSIAIVFYRCWGGYEVTVLVVYIGYGILYLYVRFGGMYVFIRVPFLCRYFEVGDLEGKMDEFIIFWLGVYVMVFVSLCGLMFYPCYVKFVYV